MAAPPAEPQYQITNGKTDWKAHKNFKPPVDVSSLTRNIISYCARNYGEKENSFAKHLCKVFQLNDASKNFKLPADDLNIF